MSKTKQMKKNRPFYGSRGTEEHEMLLNLVTYDMIKRFGELGMDVSCICSESLVMVILGLGRPGKKSSKVPDAMLISPDDELLLIEIGRFNPDKWGPMYPVLHIGFSYVISFVNPRYNQFEFLVWMILENILDSKGLHPDMKQFPVSPEEAISRSSAIKTAVYAQVAEVFD